MEEDEKYLFIDSECPYCSVFGRILTNREYKVFPVRSELGRKFSKKVLGRELLDMILYDRDEGKVYVGEDAAESIVRNEAGSGTVVASLSYDYVRKTLDTLQNRNSTGVNLTIEVEEDLTHFFE